MSKRNLLTFITALGMAAAVLGTSDRAAALGIITMPSSGIIVVGKVASDGGVWAGFEPAGGSSCTSFWFLGSNATLSLDLFVQGSAGNDVMWVTGNQDNFSFCGFTWQDFNRNGFTVSMFGADGNDQLRLADYMDGGVGDDEIVVRLASSQSNFVGSGGDGNDRLVGAGSGGQYFGGNGSDKICILSGTASVVDGGAGYDRECGRSSSTSGIESNISCSGC